MSERKKKSGKSAAGIKSSTSDPMDLGLLEQMVMLMTQHDLNTVDVRNGDRRIVLKRGPQYVAAAAPAYTPAASAAAPAPVAAASTTASPEADPTLIPVKSPMVGTYYAAPSPDAKPFVSVGSAVDEESDICVIEAMKVYNNIKAECKGTVAKILVTNGQTVEFGQILFLVKP